MVVEGTYPRTVDAEVLPVRRAAAAAEAPITSATTAIAAAQRSRPRRRFGTSEPVTTTGVGVAHATSFSWTGIVESERLAGGSGEGGVVGPAVGVVSAWTGTVSRDVSSSGAPGFVPESRGSGIGDPPGVGSSPAGQCTEGRTLAATGELLHQFLHLEELLHEPVDVRQCGARTCGDPPSARAVEDRRVAAFGPGHRPDDRLGPLEIAPIHRSLRLTGEVAHPGDHRHDLAERPHLLHLLHRFEHVIEGEAALAELLLELRGLLLVDMLLRSFDEGHDVAHAEDPARKPVGMEDLECIGLLAGAHELHR